MLHPILGLGVRHRAGAVPLAAGRAADQASVGTRRSRPWLVVVGLLKHALLAVAATCMAFITAPVAQAARITSVSPQGEVAQVRQVRVRFSEAVVAGGDPRPAAPLLLACNGAAPAGDGRWANDREWLFDLRQPLPAATRCVLRANPAFQALGGLLQGPTEFRFATGGPAVEQVQPWPETEIEEDSHFLLRLNGAADLDSVRRHAWCEVQGLGDRIPVRVIDGAERERLLRALRRDLDRRVPASHWLLLQCQRPLPPEAGVRLVWGAGIAAEGAVGANRPLTRSPQQFAWQVRPRFTAEFTCERENAQAACMPLRPLVLRFSAPVAREQAQAVRLVGEAGGASVGPLAPRGEAGDRAAWVHELVFPAPLPEHARLHIELPPQVVDDSGRALANAGAFPLAVATGGLPPLAKFAGSGFGILEAGSGPDQPALLPLTLRHVQADLAQAATGGQVAIQRLQPQTPDAELLQWLARLQKDQRETWRTREQPMLAAEAGARRAELPQLRDSEPRAAEVIGIPLPQRGYHVVEVQSHILGESLLARRAPMYARTGVLVTNLGVHLKRGHASSLVWVTTLDRGRPVSGARVVVNNCKGEPLWSGRTDEAGLARIAQPLESDDDAEDCATHDGLFVTARTADDLSFVFSRWSAGIEPWRFGIPALGRWTRPATQVAHTVMDRSLLRVGDTVSMKHFVRETGERGLTLPGLETLPDALLVTHVASDTVYRLPLQWPAGARASESQWTIPRTAPLGLYDLSLVRGDERLASGSLRVEAFRVPLVEARLDAPAGAQVAPAELRLLAQLNALAGGAMGDQPLQLSALLRPARPQFAEYADFRFEPPEPDEADTDASQAPADDDDPSAAGLLLVADKLAARTDARGAAPFVLQLLPQLQALGGPADLQAELSFADPNGETQTVARSVRLWPAAVVAGVRATEWAAARGVARFTALVLDTEGRPLAGRAVSVQGQHRQTLSVRKRIVGGFYAYESQRSTRDLGSLCSGRTDARGRLACEAKIGAVGEVQLVVQAQDDAGRSSRAATSIWMTGPGEWWFAQGNDDRIELLPESRSVEPGQTARLQVRMPFRQATALVTVEREGVLWSRVQQLNGREPVVELPVPPDAAAAWAPNVAVSVLVLRGRLREAPWWSLFTWGWKQPADWWRAFRWEGRDWQAPSALADLARPSFKLGVTQLAVGLAAHRLDVSVTPAQTQVGTRETVPTTVRVSHQGKPVAGAQLAFAAVDEGLLALQDNRSWDLLGALMRPRPWAVETATAQGEIIGRRHYGRKALPAGGSGGRNPTRELFDTLLLWRGTVTTDAQGLARIEVPVNDSLTRFRLVAVADDSGPPDAPVQRFGTGSASLLVTRDLQMLPGLAPLVREGDRFEAGFTLRNTTERAMQVQATLRAQPQTQPGAGAAAPLPAIEPPAQQLVLAAGASVEVRWPVAVPEGVHQIIWTGRVQEVGATAGAARDELQVTQAVQPVVPQQVWQATLQGLRGSLDWPVAPPADALPGRSQTLVTLKPQLSSANPGLQRWFEAYAYTCLEQQVSRALALGDEPGWARLRDELPGYLDSDGLAQFFPPQPGSPQRGSDSLTAYLLSSADQAGRSWPDATRDAMLDGLAAFVEGRIQRRVAGPRPDLDLRKLAALDALARHGRARPRMLDSLDWTPARWPSSALLDAWGLLDRLPGVAQREARQAELQRLLRARLVADGSALGLNATADEAGWGLMDGADASAVRLLLRAVDDPAWHEDLPRLLAGTLQRQRGGAWDTTTANLWGLLALQRFAAVHEREPVAGRSLLQLGAQQAQQDWQARPEGATMSLAGPEQATRLTARHEGAGQPWLSVQMLAAVPVQTPVSSGYRIHKTLTPVQRRLPQVWSRGDIVRVRLEVEALADRAWVVIHDPVPAGATLLGGGLGRDSALATAGEQRLGNAWLAYEERAADAWRAYYEWMPRGRQVVEYTLRLNSAGRLGVPPTRVEAMYAPDSFGLWPNPVIEVQP